MDESYGDEQPELLHCSPLHSNTQWGAADLPRFPHGQSIRPHQEAMVRSESRDGGLQTLSWMEMNRSISLVTERLGKQAVDIYEASVCCVKL